MRLQTAENKRQPREKASKKTQSTQQLLETFYSTSLSHYTVITARDVDLKSEGSDSP